MQRHQSPSAYLVDLDGTLISSGAALPFAASLLASLEGRFVVLSNDAEHMPEQLSRIAARHEPACRAGADRARRRDRHRPGGARDAARARDAAGEHRLRTYARRLGIDLVETGGDVVLLGRDRQFSYVRLAAAANAVRDGAELIVANPDRTHPGRDGTVVPETGALLSR